MSTPEEETKLVAKQTALQMMSPSGGRYREGQLKWLVARRPAYRIVNLVSEPGPFPEYENRYDLEELRRRGVRWVVLNEVYRHSFLVESSVRMDRERFVAQLQSQADLVADFDPLKPGTDRFFVDHEAVVTPFNRIFQVQKPGPHLKIYALKPELGRKEP